MCSKGPEERADLIQQPVGVARQTVEEQAHIHTHTHTHTHTHIHTHTHTHTHTEIHTCISHCVQRDQKKELTLSSSLLAWHDRLLKNMHTYTHTHTHTHTHTDTHMYFILCSKGPEEGADLIQQPVGVARQTVEEHAHTHTHTHTHTRTQTHTHTHIHTHTHTHAHKHTHTHTYTHTHTHTHTHTYTHTHTLTKSYTHTFFTLCSKGPEERADLIQQPVGVARQTVEEHSVAQILHLCDGCQQCRLCRYNLSVSKEKTTKGCRQKQNVIRVQTVK